VSGKYKIFVSDKIDSVTFTMGKTIKVKLLTKWQAKSIYTCRYA